MMRTLNTIVLGAFAFNLIVAVSYSSWLCAGVAALLAHGYGVLRYEDGRLDALGVER